MEKFSATRIYIYILLVENKFEKSKSKTLYRASQCAMDSIHNSIPLPPVKIESSAKFPTPAKTPCIRMHDDTCTQIKRHNLSR